MMEEFAKLIPANVLERSGSVFYSGRAAFSAPSPLYILGLNPGGSAELMAEATVAWHTAKALSNQVDEWSEYAHESWEGAPPGTWRLQPRLLHMLASVGLDPARVPASNVVFARSSRESTFEGSLAQHAAEAWPFHRAVIDKLGVKVVLCLGGKAAKIARRNLHARELVEEFVEDNDRKWRSQWHRSASGISVVAASHPSVAEWRNPRSDPTPLLRRALQAAGKV